MKTTIPLKAACLALFLLVSLVPLWVRATDQLVSTSTENSSGFLNGTLDPFTVCTTVGANWPFATTLNGQPCAQFTWHESAYNGTRETRGSEVCSSITVQKEGWYGFYLYVPDPGYPKTKSAGVAQWFAANSQCNSWAAILGIENNNLIVDHRTGCVNPTRGTVLSNIPRNRWISVINHFVVSHQNQGTMEFWIDGVKTYTATGINFGFDSWDQNDALKGRVSITFKMGQYAWDSDNYDQNEIRTLYYSNVSQIDGTSVGAFEYIQNPVAGTAPTSPPSPPAGLTATPGFNQVALSWNSSSGASSYKVKRATTSGGPYTAIASPTTISYLDTEVVGGTSYYYVVSAVNAAGESANSSQVSTTPIAVGGMISINFRGGGSANGTPSAMAASESAGVVNGNNWNNASGAIGTVSSLVQNNGTASGASVTWVCNNTWSTSIADTAGNARMMKGYLDTSSSSTTTVSLSGLPAALTANGYDVYVYCDGDNGSSTKTGVYSIGSKRLKATDNSGVNFTGIFTQANSSPGNYVIFANMTGSSFQLQATGSGSDGGGARAPVNGIQIVARP